MPERVNDLFGQSMIMLPKLQTNCIPRKKNNDMKIILSQLLDFSYTVLHAIMIDDNDLRGCSGHFAGNSFG